FSFIIQNHTEEFPSFKLIHKPVNFMFTNLFIKCVQELLPRCCTGICSPMVQSTAKTSEVKKTFRRSVKRNTHPVQQVNDFRRRISHCFYWRLVCQEVTTVNRVVKMYSS